MADKLKRKKKPGNLKTGTDRRNMWLLIVTTLLVVVSVALFTPPSQKINQGLDIQGGLSVVLTASNNDGSDISAEDMEVSRSIIENRVNALGASEATVQIQGDDQILVQIPGLSDAEEALKAIGRTGSLEFARLDSFTDEDVASAIDSGEYIQEEIVTDDYGNTFISSSVTYMDVEEGTYTPIVTGSNIKNVQISQEPSGLYWAVNLDLDSEGAKAFAKATSDLAPTQGKIVIILDGEVNSAPAVQSQISDGQVQISGNYTQEQAQALKTVLESGSLPVSFSYEQSQTVGPTLGQDALAKGAAVAAAGLLVVMLYLIFFYRGLGLLTAASMMVFACLYMGLLALLSHFGLFSLSLSGIAGIVLTIGMAADSSILTLERFREEIRHGRSVRAASVTGVRHGIMTSIDADLVTLISALALFFLATASVKGFGLTLSLGIICDIVMMVIFKAPIIRVLAPKVIAKNPGFWGVRDCQAAAEAYGKLAAAEGVSVEMAISAEAINAKDNRSLALRRAGEEGARLADLAGSVKGRFLRHDINFLKYRKVFLGVAAAVMLLCVACIGIRGVNPSIEFVGGTSITFNEAGEVTEDQVRQAFEDQGEDSPVIQSTEGNGSSGYIVRITESDATAAAALAAGVAEDLGLSTQDFQVNTIGPDWGSTIIKSMVVALLVSFVLIVVYIAFRFEYKMGLTALASLLHDIVLVVGVYALVGREMSPNTIAALLTILGYSLYDTVVVFHRISDNMANSQVKCTFMTMANHSINQVFVRSLNTTLTSLLPVIAMLLFGSDTLKDFAFAMTIGLISGAYSSIAIACPLFAMWKTREPEYAKLEKKYGSEVSRFEFARGALKEASGIKYKVAPDVIVEAKASEPAEALDTAAGTAKAQEQPFEAALEGEADNGQETVSDDAPVLEKADPKPKKKGKKKGAKAARKAKKESKNGKEGK